MLKATAIIVKITTASLVSGCNMLDLNSSRLAGLKNNKIAYLLFILATPFHHVNSIRYG